jgi:hypothetical protein
MLGRLTNNVFRKYLEGCGRGQKLKTVLAFIWTHFEKSLKTSARISPEYDPRLERLNQSAHGASNIIMQNFR